MIYDDPKEIVRRYGQGWKVIATNLDGNPNDVMCSFFGRDSGYWKQYSANTSGINEVNWETLPSGIIEFTNPYTESTARITPEALTATIALLYSWQAARGS